MTDRLPHEKGFHVSWDQIHRDSRALAWRLDKRGPGTDGAWAAVPRRALHSGLGRAEASSGYALVAAAALVARGEASEALVLGGMRSAVMATLLRKPGA